MKSPLTRRLALSTAAIAVAIVVATGAYAGGRTVDQATGPQVVVQKELRAGAIWDDPEPTHGVAAQRVLASFLSLLAGLIA
jgi:hypothetical protein